MKLKLYFFIAINVILGLVGALLIFWGIIDKGEIARPFLESIGVGFIAAGFVNIFDRALTLEPPPVLKQRIEVITEKRNTTPQEIHDRKYQAAKVDLIGISLTHILREFTSDPGQKKIIDRLLNNNLQLRLFMVHPHSKYLEQRALEDDIEIAKLIEKQKTAVKLCVDFYEKLNAAYDAAANNNQLDIHMTGHLQIKLMDFCPYVTIYRLNEEDIYWGLYTSDKAGVNLPLFKTSSSQDAVLYRHLYQHIHGVMERDKKYPDLVCMPDLGKPVLNKKVLADALK
jgi:hypothetical protein